jgi:acyl-coenzyme A thioesterase PaaI-like protein
MFSQHTLQKFINLWPPLFFAGIRARVVTPDFRTIEAELRLRWWNRNSMGTQFGGSLFAMTDPFYMLMLQQNLGPRYIVWDKAAAINFIAPGRGTVHAKFTLSQAQIDEIITTTAHGEKFLSTYQVEIRDKSNTLIATVTRTLYIRLKPQHRPAASPLGTIASPP